MLTQSQIESICSQYKGWYKQHWPLCLYCGHTVKNGDLSHIIRRSYSMELQTVKLNCGLSHRSCHEIWDDKPDQQIYLPRIIEILYIVYLLDEQYFNLIAGNFEDLAHVLQLFPSVEYRNIQHHGEITQLNYLYQ
jgi:lipopolysaccharide biosynthesis protein